MDICALFMNIGDEASKWKQVQQTRQLCQEVVDANAAHAEVAKQVKGKLDRYYDETHDPNLAQKLAELEAEQRERTIARFQRATHDFLEEQRMLKNAQQG